MKITLGPNEIAKGWALDYSQANNNGVEAPAGKYSRSYGVSLFRNGRIGHVSPGETVTDLSDLFSAVNALPLNGAISYSGSNDGRAWIILENGRIVMVESDAVNSTYHTPSRSGWTIEGQDVLVYKNATNEYVLYSYNDIATSPTPAGGDVGRMLKDGTTPVDNFLSNATGGSLLTDGVPHRMCVGPDGNVYITNGQYIVRLTISTSVVTMQALNLGTGFVANDIKMYRNKLYIAGNKLITNFQGNAKNDARVWVWDSASDFYENLFFINDNHAAALHVADYLYVFTEGQNSTTKIKRFNGNDFETLFESFQIGAAPKPGSIDTFQNMLHYAPEDSGNLMCLDGRAFHFRTQLTSDGTTVPAEVGMVKNLFANKLYFGRYVGGAYKISITSYSGYHVQDTTAGKYCDFIYPIVGLPYKSTIRKMIVYFSQFGTGASVKVSTFKNYATISVGGSDDITNQTIDYTTLGARSSYSFEVKNGFDTDCFVINLRFNHASYLNTAAIVRKIEVYYDTPEKQ